MAEMIATKLKRYAGKDLKPGDRFEAEDGHVRTLTLSRLAERAPVETQVDNQYNTRHMVAGARRKKAH